jgi:hypothetical protein
VLVYDQAPTSPITAFNKVRSPRTEKNSGRYINRMNPGPIEINNIDIDIETLPVGSASTRIMAMP